MDATTPNVPAAADALRASARRRGILVALLVNVVPIVGVLRYGWSATNVLVLYWFENVLVAVFTCVRLIVHRRLTRKRGYWRTDQIGGLEVNGKPVHTNILGEYALTAFLFTAAHGVFVGVIVMIFAQNYPDQPMWHVSLPQVARGVLAITAMLGAELLVDLTTIRARSFAEMKGYVQGRLSRVFVLHLAIIFGMLAMAMADSPFGVLYVLIGLKTLADVGGVIGRTSRAAAIDPAAPPEWMLRAADRLAKDKGGAAGLQKKLREDAERERRNAIEDEEPMPHG
jgi:Family of unknown function (DUF6498)